MMKRTVFACFIITVILTACGSEDSQKKSIIPPAQIDALDKAKNIQQQLFDSNEQQKKALKEQGL